MTTSELVPVRRSNGRAFEVLKWLVSLALAALVSYFTTLQTMSREIVTVTEREQNHFHELQRVLQEIKADIRELRAEQRQSDANKRNRR